VVKLAAQFVAGSRANMKLSHQVCRFVTVAHRAWQPLSYEQ
jgi:hypothetical protein